MSRTLDDVLTEDLKSQLANAIRLRSSGGIWQLTVDIRDMWVHVRGIAESADMRRVAKAAIAEVFQAHGLKRSDMVDLQIQLAGRPKSPAWGFALGAE